MATKALKITIRIASPCDNAQDAGIQEAPRRTHPLRRWLPAGIVGTLLAAGLWVYLAQRSDHLPPITGSNQGRPIATAGSIPPATAKDAESTPSPSAPPKAMAKGPLNTAGESKPTPPPSKPVSTTSSPRSPHVRRAQFTSTVKQREPVDLLGPNIPVTSDTLRRIYYFTEITNLSGETVTHRWEFNGNAVARIRFPIGGDRWRVYSSKYLTPAMTGQWRVVVIDSRGNTLSSDTFHYGRSR